MWNLNWFRSGGGAGGSGETVYVQIDHISARIIKNKEIKAIVLEDVIILAKIEDIEIQTIIHQEQKINLKIEN